jgi:large subunit ribosomal protein L24
MTKVKMKLRKGDKVIVISGGEKGLKGEIVKVYPSENTVVVTGVNKKHNFLKPSQSNPEGGVVSIEKPIDASKVALLDPKTDLPTRVGYMFLATGEKVRFAKRSGETIDVAKVGG